MKLVFVFITVGIFFFLIGLFIIQNFSPFDISKLNEIVESSEISSTAPEKLDDEISALISNGLIFDYISMNAYLVFFLFIAGITSIVAAFHMFIDKVFFKSLWQQPSLLTAMRRAFLISASLTLVVYLKLLKVDVWSLVLIPVSAIVLEFVYLSLEKDIKQIHTKILKKSENTETQELTNKPITEIK